MLLRFAIGLALVVTFSVVFGAFVFLAFGRKR